MTMIPMRATPAEIPGPEQDAGEEMSDEALDHVVGGLERVWAPYTPFTDHHNGVAPAAPPHDLGAVVDARDHMP